MWKSAFMCSLILLICGPALAQRDRETNTGQERAPFKIFDNLYYVGINFVSAYIISTSDGLILIDSTYDRNVDHVLSGIEKMGFDPKDIKFILVTHWHADHFGGAPAIHKLTGATVGMIGEDWDALKTAPDINSDQIWRIKDGDTLTLGDTTLKLFHLPGHTLGVLGIEYTLYDDGTAYRGLTFGGNGFNFSGVEQTEMFINSTKRVLAMEGMQVNIGNHQTMGNVFERARRLEGRKQGDPHPFVDPDAFIEYHEVLLMRAHEKLEREMERAKRALDR